jgi:hypothetical protein
VPAPGAEAPDRDPSPDAIAIALEVREADRPSGIDGEELEVDGLVATGGSEEEHYGHGHRDEGEERREEAAPISHPRVRAGAQPAARSLSPLRTSLNTCAGFAASLRPSG